MEIGLAIGLPAAYDTQYLRWRNSSVVSSEARTSGC
jgi:hypothetical protein